MRRRSNPIGILLIAILISPGLIFVCRAEEQITITTFYPAPNGIYREMRVNQMSVGKAYRSSSLADGNMIISGSVSIGSASTSAGKLNVVMKNGRSRFTINDDNNVGVELRSVGWIRIPYIDFSNDPFSNFDVRLILNGDNILRLDGGTMSFNTRCAKTYDPLNQSPYYRTNRYDSKYDHNGSKVFSEISYP
ncbi:MAG: hypothetical protein AUJ74_06105 [Candidatus Omnitrophica bacterium CG1_02_44_16]|nr:MAG: hypothetical protein AUJ74_06105 [Candidatus Omnitrophica bacterium CG1_02_44_16]PIY83056.1 MAG: hypothetical protein COY78_03710 [Candidatus Omnitrophica bacterium CG_4_10_14_0_8_um_filter_44_12]PIZ83383.1 MAG: hypothetical protein COX96_08130 [Candidatus Omnitrophica bacterium CG_4_10_14_0_2_um_filter_44_9]